MNTNINALISRTAQNDTVIFNDTTSGLDLRHPEFSLEAFEQKGNGMRLVIKDGLVVFGKESSMDSDKAVVKFLEDLSEKQDFISAASQLMRYGFEGFVPGFHPAPARESNKLNTKLGVVKSNYAGNDFGFIPEDGQWYAVVSAPVAGSKEEVVKVSAKAEDYFTQTKNEAIDLLIDGMVFAAYWPKGETTRGEQLVNWLATVLGHNQAVIDGDEGAQAIYRTRYNERVMDKNLGKKAANVLRGKSAEELAAFAKEQGAELILTTIDGGEIIVSELGTGSPIRFYGANGRYKGQQVWNPASAYSVQKIEEAAKMGWAAQVLFDTAAISR